MRNIFSGLARVTIVTALFLATVAGCGGGSDGNSNSSTGGPAPIEGATVSATASLDTTNSQINGGNSAQAGRLVLVSASATSSATFNNDPSTITPGASINNQLLRTGDGVGANFTMSGDYNGTPAVTDGMHSDFWFDIENPSTTATVRVTFRAVVANQVTATGADAFAFSALSVRDASNAEVFFSEHRIDTLNPVNDLNDDSASNVFSIDLAPGAVTRISALQSQRGGAINGGDYSATLDAFIRVESVEPV